MSEIISDHRIRLQRTSDPTFECYGAVIRDDTPEQEFFFLMQRRLTTVNRIFSGKIEALIKYYLRAKSDGPVRILDIGAGFDGLTAREVAQKFERTEVIGIDLTEGHYDPVPHYRHIMADAISLGQHIPDKSIDLIYSHEFFAHLQPSITGKMRERFARRRPFYESALRALQPNGVALVQEMRDIWESAPARSWAERNGIEVARFGRENNYTYRLSHQPVAESIRSLIPQILITRT